MKAYLGRWPSVPFLMWCLVSVSLWNVQLFPWHLWDSGFLSCVQKSRFRVLQQLNPFGDLASQFNTEKSSHHFVQGSNLSPLNLSVLSMHYLKNKVYLLWMLWLRLRYLKCMGWIFTSFQVGSEAPKQVLFAPCFPTGHYSLLWLCPSHKIDNILSLVYCCFLFSNWIFPTYLQDLTF